MDETKELREKWLSERADRIKWLKDNDTYVKWFRNKVETAKAVREYDEGVNKIIKSRKGD